MLEFECLYIPTTPIFYCFQTVLVSDSRPLFERWARFFISRRESGAENVKPGPGLTLKCETRSGSYIQMLDPDQTLHFQFKT